MNGNANVGMIVKSHTCNIFGFNLLNFEKFNSEHLFLKSYFGSLLNDNTIAIQLVRPFNNNNSVLGHWTYVNVWKISRCKIELFHSGSEHLRFGECLSNIDIN